MKFLYTCFQFLFGCSLYHLFAPSIIQKPEQLWISGSSNDLQSPSYTDKRIHLIPHRSYQNQAFIHKFKSSRIDYRNQLFKINNTSHQSSQLCSNWISTLQWINLFLKKKNVSICLQLFPPPLKTALYPRCKKVLKLKAQDAKLNFVLSNDPFYNSWTMY